MGSRLPFPPMPSYNEKSDPLIIHPLASLQFWGQAGEFQQVFDFNKAIYILALVSFGNGVRIFPKSGKILGMGFFARAQTSKKPGLPASIFTRRFRDLLQMVILFAVQRRLSPGHLRTGQPPSRPWESKDSHDRLPFVQSTSCSATCDTPSASGLPGGSFLSPKASGSSARPRRFPGRFSAPLPPFPGAR